MNLNKIILSGNLTRDVDYSVTPSGSAYAKMGIAVNRQFSKDNQADFFNLIAWNKTAEFCHNYLSKGRRVVVEGRLQNNDYTDSIGNKRTGYSIVVDNIEFADNKRNVENPDENIPEPSEYDDVDLPF